MFANTVTIGPEFFAKAFHDYSDRHWAFVREVLQNSLDCGSTTIAVGVTYEPLSDRTVVVVEFPPRLGSRPG